MIIEDVIMRETGSIVGREIVSANFEEWLIHVFDHPPRAGHWRWNDDFVEWAVAPSETAFFLARTFEKSGSLFEKFSDAQVADGIDYISNMALSEIARSLLDESVPWSIRQNGIRSIKTLYSDLFEVHCDSRLSYLNEGAGNPLNVVCYMWWDVFPIVGQPEIESNRSLDKECLAVMEYALGLKFDACRESALHGLGHWFHSYPEETRRLIDHFLTANPNARPELIAYARNARKGYVQ